MAKLTMNDKRAPSELAPVGGFPQPGQKPGASVW
jgi:hypothetical protein